MIDKVKKIGGAFITCITPVVILVWTNRFLDMYISWKDKNDY